jgi:calcium-dependent protein kinase
MRKQRRVTTLKHPNIIAFVEYYEDFSTLYLVMEYAAGGQLFDHITSGSFPEAAAQTIVRQMLQAIQAMHELGVVHADIKPDNFMFSDTSETAVLKLIDFGQSDRILRPMHLLRRYTGTQYYMSPEQLDQAYNCSTDMWSIGCVIYAVLFGMPPFYDQNDEGIFRLIRAGFTPVTREGPGPWFPAHVKISDAAKDFIGQLLLSDVAARLTANEALDHPWIVSAVDDHPINTRLVSALTRFQRSSKFKQAVCNVMARDLTAENIRQFKFEFARLDTNRDGTVTVMELEAAIKQMSMVSADTLASLDAILSHLDADGSGVISYAEWLAFVMNRHLGAKEERMMQAFKRLDVNGDGKITTDEIRAVLGDDAQLAAMYMLEADTNRDGAIDLHEFCDMWYRQWSHQARLELERSRQQHLHLYLPARELATCPSCVGCTIM